MNKPAIRAGAEALLSHPVYLVLERDPFVAEDIAASIQALGPCRVIRVRSEAGIRDILEEEDDVRAAFLDVKYAQVRKAKLDELLKRHGAQIILTVGEDDEDQATDLGWGMLIRPFTERMIQQAVTEKAAP